MCSPELSLGIPTKNDEKRLQNNTNLHGYIAKNYNTNNIKNTLNDTKNPFKAFSLYKQLLQDIKDYNRADTVNMTEEEMNKFRHIAAPAYLTNKYYPGAFVKTLGISKEVKDLLQLKGINDTRYDLSNNNKGINIGTKTKGLKMTQKDLFDYIFKTEIEPYRK